MEMAEHARVPGPQESQVRTGDVFFLEQYLQGAELVFFVLKVNTEKV